MTNRIGGGVASHAAPQAANVGSSAFSGSALIGKMLLTGGTTTGDWFTDLHVRWRSALLPFVNMDGDHWMQVLQVPNAGDDGETSWLEVSHHVAAVDVDNPLGALTVGMECVAGGAGNIIYKRVTGDDWRDGVAVADYELICVASTGAVTIKKNGATVATGTVGATTFNQPPNGSTVEIGGSLHPLYSFDVLDGIDGDPIISFDAEDPTGWTSAGGSVTTAPSRAAYVGASNDPFTLPANAVFDAPADQDQTWVLAYRPLGSGPQAARNFPGFFGGDPGWALIEYTDAEVPHSFFITDGTETVMGLLGALAFDDQVVVAVLDRTADTLTTYVNGVQTGQATTAALGAVSPTATTVLGLAPGWWYAAGQINRKLTPAEIASLPNLLGV